ncbi:MAG TPA: alpha/beta hydrolase, partial [Micromonospora sp.]
AEQLRRHGFTGADVAELLDLRRVVEGYLRGGLPRATAQAAVDRAAGRDWFPLAYLRREVAAEPGAWRDMDFDPAAVVSGVRCPALLFHGATDEWMPIDDSVAAWRRAAADPTMATFHRLAGCDHLPTVGGGADPAAISADYTGLLLDWLDRLPLDRLPLDRRLPPEHA